MPQGNRIDITRPRVVLCGLRGGSGKTAATIGVIAALRKRGVSVAPFKKGPDYIDPQWLSLAAERPCRNLDSFFMRREQILQSVANTSDAKDVAIIEGNRGLFDGMDETGTYSTADLALQLNSPVILVIDCTKTTRTAAAMALGCKALNPDLMIRGVILNQIACDRQEKIIRAAVENEAGTPVIGSIRRLKDFVFPERNLGLNPPGEHGAAQTVLDRLREAVEAGVNLDEIRTIADSAPLLCAPLPPKETMLRDEQTTVRIGVIRDEAFHFYYPENLEMLQMRGAKIVEVNALHDYALPSIDALYIGGGFPERFAEALTDNAMFRYCLRREIDAGLPVLAECGGLIYLSESIDDGQNTHPMAGVFPVAFRVSKRPEGHGYTIVKVDRANPFFPMGAELRGHEFRYSAVQTCRHDMTQSAFQMQRGFGFDGERDGLLYKNCLASFCHHHALSHSSWADGLVNQAWLHRRRMYNQSLV